MSAACSPGGCWPAAIVVPLLIGALSWKAFSAGVFSEWSGITVMIVAMITLLAGLTVWSGRSIDRSDVERRHAEASLHRSEEELREAQRLARVGSWWWDPTTDTVTWSEGLYRIAGRDPKMPPPASRSTSAFYTAESFAPTERRGGTGRCRRGRRSSSSWRWCGRRRPRSVTSRGEAERDADGQVVLVRGTVHDVTEHKQAEEALRRSADEIRDLYNHAPCGYHSLDKEGVFVRINDTELEWLGYAREDMIGKMKFSDLLAPSSLSTFEAEFPRLKSGRQRSRYRVRSGPQGRHDPTGARQRHGHHRRRRKLFDEPLDGLRHDRAQRVRGGPAPASAYNRSLIEAALDLLLTIGPDGSYH